MNGDPLPKNSVSQFTLTPEILRQIDIAEPSPQQLHKAISAKIGDKLDGIPLYAMWWWSFNSFASITASIAPDLLSYCRMIADEMTKRHYGEAAIRLGLVDVTQSQTNGNNHGVSSQSESNSTESPASDTPPTSRIIIPE